MDIKNIVEQFQTTGTAGLASFYEENRKDFLQWIKKVYRCDNDDAKDIYQSAIISFYENMMHGKLSELKSTARTYLFAIGRNKAMEFQRKQARFVPLEGSNEKTRDDDEVIVDAGLLKLALESLDKLGDPCRVLLQEFYFHHSTMSNIVTKLGYKNEVAAKSQKYKCLLRLRKMFKATYKIIQP